MSRHDAAAAGTVLILAFGALMMGIDRVSAAQAVARPRASDLQAVLDCRAVKDSDKRLACFDAAAAKLDEAEASGKVVIVDRAQATQVRKEIFGLKLPSLDVFGPIVGGKTSAVRGVDVDRIADTVAKAWPGASGRWTVELASGAVWRQIDDEQLDSAPHAGSKAEIRRAALGSFFMKIDGQRSIRATRDR
jgi:hypothetical protein